MTTPAPQQRNVLADLSYALGQLDGNGLISRLFREQLGGKLSPQQLEHVIAIVGAFEEQTENSSQAAPVLPPVFPVSPAAPVTA
jgi:hypothetical protein